MDTLQENTVIAPPPRLELVVCSHCLRVLRDAGWVTADEVIRELRTYDEPEAPLLHAALCDGCEGNARVRRANCGGAARSLTRVSATASPGLPG